MKPDDEDDKGTDADTHVNGGGEKKTGRPPKGPMSIDDLKGFVLSLKSQIEKMAAIQAAIAGLKGKPLNVEWFGVDGSIDNVTIFCDAALREARKRTPRSERKWDLWDRPVNGGEPKS